MNAITPAVLQNAELLRDLCDKPLTGTLTEMARALERDPSNFAKTIQRLAVDGLVEHAADQGRLLITETGRRAILGIDVADGRIDVPEGAALVPHELIFRDILNPRKEFAQEDIAALAESIAEVGLLQPILIRPAETVDWANVPVHRLVAGERRWRAIRVLIEDGRWPADRPIRCEIQPMDDVEHAMRALVENEQRVDLNHVERGRAYEHLATRYEKTNLAIATLVNRTVEYVQQHRRLLRLDEQMLQWVAEGKLSFQEALKLVPTPQKANKAAAEEPAQLDLEAAVRRHDDHSQMGTEDAAAHPGDNPEPGRPLPDPEPPLQPAEAQSGAIDTSAVTLSARQRLVLIECAHKIEEEGTTPEGRFYRGAPVGQYWLDQTASEMVAMRVITFANPGKGWLVILTELGEALAFADDASGLRWISAEDLTAARVAASQSAWPHPYYVTPWLNLATPDADFVADQAAEEASEVEAIKQAEKVGEQVGAYAREICDAKDRGQSYSIGSRARELAKALDRPLPWKLAKGDDDATIGCVFDAAGEVVCVVDPDRFMPDAQARAIALMIVIAANSFGGERPLPLPTEA